MGSATSLTFIGGGVMAEAMIRGILQQGTIPAGGITVTGPRAERRVELATRFGIRGLAGNAAAAADASVVVLAVKPQVLPAVMRELRGSLKPEQLVLSIIAGATMHALTTGLGHAAVVRAMPNTPAQVAMGVTAWYAAPAVTEEQRATTRSLLEALGEQIAVEDEHHVDMATALSGTGPTYVFLLMEAMVDAGVHLGFSRRVAEELVLRTVEGSAMFARQSGRHLAELRNMVTSPGGTTAAGLRALEDRGVRSAFIEAIAAATQRANELG